VTKPPFAAGVNSAGTKFEKLRTDVSRLAEEVMELKIQCAITLHPPVLTNVTLLSTVASQAKSCQDSPKCVSSTQHQRQP